MWVKIHDIPFMGFTEDGLRAIATKIVRPMMLDTCTSTMCCESWGRPDYARVMLEMSSEYPLKDSLIVATSLVEGKGYTKESIGIEYEWKPPRCSLCKIFGHNDIIVLVIFLRW